MEEYSEELIEEIKESIDIVDFIGEYVELKKKGREYFGNCPFHDERTGSFSVTPHKGVYYCFGCKKGGDIIDFCQDYLNMTYEQTINYLGSEAGISTVKTKISPTVRYLRKSTRKRKNKQIPEPHKILDKSVLSDFERRKITKWIEEGIPQSIMDYYMVMYDKESNRIVYPVFDNSGNLINVKGRTLFDNYKDYNIPKYMNYYPVGDLDYFQAFCFKKKILDRSKEVIIFESLKSVMKLDSFGIYNSISSETSQINIFQVRELVQLHCDVVIAFDSDVSLEEIKKKDTIQLLCHFTNVYVVYDSNGLLGGKTEKNSPVDKGKEIWEELYKQRIKI